MRFYEWLRRIIAGFRGNGAVAVARKAVIEREGVYCGGADDGPMSPDPNIGIY